MTIGHILRNTLRPGYLPEMLHKLALRLRHKVEDPDARARATEWCAARVEDAGALAERLDSALWAEAETWGRELGARGERLGTLKSQLGRGGHYPFLYFLTRYRRPETIVETGVSAGYSSAAFLAAIKANGAGRLYSSDFPLFRLDSPEQHIGRLVDPDLRGPWTLLVNGDRRNLPQILATAGPVDLFHYDSDKTASGRAFGMAQIEPRLAPGGVVVMDDIQDNLFFAEYVERRGGSCRVFGFEGKYLGVIGI